MILIKILTFLYLQHWDANDLCNWVMMQKLLVNNFEWIKDTSKFNEDMKEKYYKESNEEFVLHVDV